MVAPDHMLLPETDQDARRVFNTTEAGEFIQLVQQTELTPMAVAHGMTVEERIAYARQLVAMGYTHLALGGLAAIASSKARVIEIVSAIRAALPDVWLHVLGLSAPFYFAQWQRLHINSCDGASQFKQAFSGTFFIAADGKLHKHHAAKKPDDPITAPQCDCCACARLRDYGIDTRRFGSNQHNMGRAAHNLNMLMRAHAHIRNQPTAPTNGVVQQPAMQQLAMQQEALNDEQLHDMFHIHAQR